MNELLNLFMMVWMNLLYYEVNIVYVCYVIKFWMYIFLTPRSCKVCMLFNKTIDD